MLRLASNLVRRTPSSYPAPSSSSSSLSSFFDLFSLPATFSSLRRNTSSSELVLQQQQHQNPNQPPLSRVLRLYSSASGSRPSLSIWRRKKEIGKEGLIVAKELKRLRSNPLRLDRFIRSHVSRLLKSDLVAVLAEFQRQDQVFLSMKIYDVVRKEIWYKPDMFFYRDMLMMLARNKKVDESKQVWEDLKREGVLFDQHTFGDIIRAYLDSGLPSEAMEIYDEMRRSPDPPISLPFRVILKGLLPYPELREKVKDEFLELFPGMIVYDPPEDLFEDQEWRRDSEDD
ncbi:pentatricopeptide repeat-containing protein At1g62350 [Ziziphus jujuba]|uniref:Pentatricopeptide repeat-containing protein At1g62350 n=1 Tax=Ziziphus jujuba TaxID=326968 RepID=A0A6P3ZJ56_ZIZJJ|nr:pentatricopeptide repeat-containing protein At1g62350 [Ziziphus jujuba]